MRCLNLSSLHSATTVVVKNLIFNFQRSINQFNSSSIEMSQKNFQNMSAYQIGQKLWKERPPGPEQLLLEEMFGNGSITSAATPESVRHSSDMFKQFSSKVFAVHFRKTKARFGEFGTFLN